MLYNLYFDFAAIFGFAAMIFSVCYRKTTIATSGKYFLMMLIVGFFSAIFDVLSVFDKAGWLIVYISNVAYLSLRAFTALSFCFYLIGITDNWHRLKKNKFMLILLFLPFVTVIGFLISNYWTHWVFDVVDGKYQRGMLINDGGMYLLTLIYMVVALYLILRYRQFFTKAKLVALITIYPCALVALLIQMFFSGILCEVFFTCIAYFIMLVIVETPEDLFEPEIDLKKYYALSEDLNKAIVTHKHVSILFVNVLNSNRVNSQISYQNQINLHYTIGRVIKETAIDFSLVGQYYYLGPGKYAALVIEKNKDDSLSFATTVRRRLNVPLKCAFGIVDVYSNVAIMKSPEDILNLDMCISFMDNFYHISENLKTVFNLSDVSGRRDFEIKLNMESIIKRAFISNGFEVYFQPILNLNSNEYTAVEALIRLNDEVYGNIPPSYFLKEAERSGAIHKIGDLVFNRACKLICSDFFKNSTLQFVEINLSVTQCTQEELPLHIMDILRKYNVSPKNICLEFTETVDAYSNKMMSENIRVLRDYGFTFILDDYGSGYSNLDNLATLPLEAIKLDKKLVDGKDNPELCSIIENTVRMLRDMKRKVIVEGVETEDSALLFESLNCDYIQGFYYCPPLSENDLIAFMTKDKAELPQEATSEEINQKVTD